MTENQGKNTETEEKDLKYQALSKRSRKYGKMSRIPGIIGKMPISNQK